MAGKYDREVFDAKHHATQCLCRLITSNKDGQPIGTVDDVASALDRLNKAWDALTDCLVRQREERDRRILSLIDELAEARKDE
jgi:site-specific recombinase